MKSIVRIKSINIKNIKNVKNGYIEIPQSIDEEGYVKKADIIGIYGQNGSGKTAVIEILNILKLLISGEKLSENTVNLISSEEEHSELEYEFYIYLEKKLYLLKYTLNLKKIIVQDDETGEDKPDFIVTDEKMHYKNFPGIKGEKYKGIVVFSASKEIFPKNLREHLTFKENARVEFKILENRLHAERKSLIFSKVFIDKVSTEEFTELSNFLNSIKQYGIMNLTVVSSNDLEGQNSNFLIPLNFKDDKNQIVSQGKIPLYFNKPNEVEVVEYDLIQNTINQINLVLSKIIPGLNITIRELSRAFNKKSKETVKFQLFSKNSESEFPLKYESAGIKKIFSILNSLIVVYNDSNYCLAIDELDAGIFECLLGEILEIVDRYGKGQLIFTSHNLRPLEVLDKENLIFTTTDRESNYTKLSNVKAMSNIRNIYINNIILGSNSGKKELYCETDSYEIKKAFKKAGSGH